MLQLRYKVMAIILFAALRLYDLGTAHLWYDESFSATLARLPLDRLILGTAGDTHPPLYYLVIWPLVQLFGSSEFVLRLPSVIFSLISIWLAWRVGRDLGVPETALIVGVGFMGVSPAQLHFAQEARMYTMFTALVLALVLAVIHRRWVWVSVFGTLVLYTHNYGVFFMVASGLMALIREFSQPVFVDDTPGHNPYKMAWNKSDQAQFKKLTTAFIIPGLLYIPWMIVLLTQMGQVASGYWIQPVTNGSTIYSLYMLLWGFAMPESWQPLAVMVTLGMIVYTLTRRTTRHLAIVALVPLILAVLASVAWRPILLFRGLLPSAPFLFMMIAQAVFDRKPGWKRIYAAAMILPILVAGIWGYYRYNPTNKGDVTTVINQVRQQWQPGDVIYHINDGSILSWGIYAPDLPQFEMDPCPQSNPGGLSPITSQAIGIRPMAMDQLTGRVWVVWSAGPTSTECEVYRATKLTGGQPVVLVRSDEFVLSGVWLWQQ